MTLTVSTLNRAARRSALGHRPLGGNGVTHQHVKRAAKRFGVDKRRGA